MSDLPEGLDAVPTRGLVRIVGLLIRWYLAGAVRMPRIFIPSLARDLTQGMAEVEVEAATVREALDVLDQQFPGLRERLCRGDQLAPGIQVSIDAALTRRGLFARLQPGSEVHFLPAVGGGC